MPNHVENDLFIRGSKADLQVFKETMNSINWIGEKVLLNEDVLIPYPQQFKDMDKAYKEWHRDNTIDGTEYGQLKDGVNHQDRPKDGFNSGGYEWCVKNWGTKWGFYETTLSESKNSLKYTFKTAWSPATPLIHKMGIMFKTLDITLKYYECGMAFKGTYHIKDGGAFIATTREPYHGNRGG